MQEKSMSLLFRGKKIFKPLNTGRIDAHVSCIREFVANIFFYTKNGTTIMIDAGYNYERLKEKMEWLDIDPSDIKHILITHQDTDHVGAIEDDSDLLFRDAMIYVGEVENRYLTGEVRRKVMYGLFKLSLLHIGNPKTLLKDKEVFYINDIKVEALLVPGHTWGHMVYLIDDRYLFTGDTIWFGYDGGYSFIDALAEDNRLAVQSLEKLEKYLKEKDIHPLVITGHTGYSDDLDFSFAYRDRLCTFLKKQITDDPEAPYDAYDESDDTREKAQTEMLRKKNRDSSVREQKGSDER
jgi:glyoxylase-like metal-dependent hydrolase (beta-lactamase superfamily II)